MKSKKENTKKKTPRRRITEAEKRAEGRALKAWANFRAEDRNRL